MTSRKWFGFFTILLLASLLLSACGSTKSTAAVVKIGWAGSPDTLNPGSALLSESYVIMECVYSALYERQLDNTYTLDLAESVQVSDDFLTYTYKIRSGVKFHDGQPLTAKDVAFSFNFYKNHEDFPYMNGYTTHFASVEAPDDQTVVVQLDQAIPNIESQIVFLFILPEHIWKTYDNEQAVDFENKEMIGSGPFKLVEYRQTEVVHLAKFADYYRELPKVDEVVFQSFENKDALVQAIKTGQVDMITEMPNTAMDGLTAAENVSVVTGAPFAPDITDILINQIDPANCPADGECTGHPALRDQKVRLALAHAVNKEDLIKIILLGLGTPGLTLIPDSLGIWYDNQITDYEFDIAKANQILDEAGYKDVNGDGVREMPDGSQSLTFRLNWPSDSTVAPRLAEVVSQSWEQIGIKVELQAVDPDALSSLCCPAFNYDLIIWGWGSDPDPNFLLTTMLTDEIPTGMNETGYANPDYDALFAQESSTTDQEGRKALIWQMQQMVHEDVVYIIPFYSKALQAYRTDRFKGWLTGQSALALEDISSLMVIEAVK